MLILGVVFIRTFLFSTFYIPSGSMLPSLRIGDVLVVSKMPYGFCKFSLPFGHKLPGSGRLGAWGRPQRGDIVVFRLPDNNSTDFVKRVVGLPGDRIAIRQGVVWINGSSLDDQPQKSYYAYQGADQPTGVVMRRILGQRVHSVVKTYQPGEGPADTMTEMTVPNGHYFMMGDNFDNSKDSRYLHAVGPIPEDHIIGRVEIVLGSYDYVRPRWPSWYGIPYPPILKQRFLKLIH